MFDVILIISSPGCDCSTVRVIHLLHLTVHLPVLEIHLSLIRMHSTVKVECTKTTILNRPRNEIVTKVDKRTNLNLINIAPTNITTLFRCLGVQVTRIIIEIQE